MLEIEERAAREAEIAEHCRAARYQQATTRALESFGREIFGYLVAVARSEDEASEAFAMFSEDLWRGIAGFRWQSSLRTWAYQLARHALARLQRDTRRHAGRMVPLSQAPQVQGMAEQVRTATLEYLRSEVKDRIAELRRELDPEDRTLLILRIGRNMSWRDIARVLGDAGEPDDEALTRAAARLRKRFERAKQALAALARARGIVGRDDG